MATQATERRPLDQAPAWLRPGRRYLAGFGRFLKRKPLGAAGLFMIGIVLLGAIAAPLVTLHEPTTQDVARRLQGPSAEFWLGTDSIGRDVWSRIVYGARISLLVGFVAVGMGATVGMVVGVMSGYLGGRVDTVIQRLVEIGLAFPSLLLALALMAGLGTGLDKVIIAIGLAMMPRQVRVMRGVVLSVKENPYVEAARAIGCRQGRIMLRHIAPNVAAPWLILASAALGGAILTEATLSFLGMGVPEPHPSWGRMLSGAASRYVQVAPWLVISPGAAIAVLVLGFNLLGDALRDVLDPKLRGR
ncbi:MAG: ABC transporter permease [Chloroflexi bacterium]|nr:ABC transporter permease [Chloroflexota bacterium]